MNKELVNSINKYEFSLVKLNKGNFMNELKEHLDDESEDKEEFKFNQLIDLITNLNGKRKIENSDNFHVKKIKI